MSQGRAVILLPDGVGLRNFLLGQFTATYAENRPLHVFHNIPEQVLARFQKDQSEGIGWELLKPYREALPSFVCRNAMTFAQMYWARTRSMQFNLKQASNASWRYRAAMRLSRMIGRVHASQNGLARLDRCHAGIAQKSDLVPFYRKRLKELDARIVFCSHQRPHSVVPLVLAARSLNIPTATFIFSWDNLSSKGRIPVRYDHYLVWSELMRDELLRYYPDVSRDQIHIVGTPQFDPYQDPTILWTRTQFFEKINADPDRPLICFSGGDYKTCPEDPAHLEVLMKLIREGKIQGNPQVLVRPAPVDFRNRYRKVLDAFPEIIWAQPQWHKPIKGDWSVVLPSLDDVQFLANLTHHVDLNINMASTMTLDFAINGKPVVNLAFDVAHPPVLGGPVWDVYYHFEHYRTVVDCGAAQFARSPEDLARQVSAYLENPNIDEAGRKKLVSLEVDSQIGKAYQRSVDTLQRLECGA